MSHESRVRNADFSVMWFLWTTYLGSERRNIHTSQNATTGELRDALPTNETLFTSSSPEVQFS